MRVAVRDKSLIVRCGEGGEGKFWFLLCPYNKAKPMLASLLRLFRSSFRIFNARIAR